MRNLAGKILPLLLFLSVWLTGAATAVSAHTNHDIQVKLNGQVMNFSSPPIIVQGTTLVPMRSLFEAQGAKVVWDSSTRTVTAIKDELELTYTIGEDFATTESSKVKLHVPGQIRDNYTLIPLRMLSETLGNTVHWSQSTQTVNIFTEDSFDTSITWGVNLRNQPNTDQDTTVYRMLEKHENIHVVREWNESWLEVITPAGEFGYISAKPKFTDYQSETLRAKQADALLELAETYLGTPYEFGAKKGQTDTFDCSSYVWHLYNEILGIDLPRVSYNQAKEGKTIELDEAKPGDLLFFSARGLDIGHVAIYAGDGKVIHTFSKKYGVVYNNLEDGNWMDRLVKVQRVF